LVSGSARLPLTGRKSRSRFRRLDRRTALAWQGFASPHPTGVSLPAALRSARSDRHDGRRRRDHISDQ